MPPSTTSYFPDINVWVALTYEGHVHHAMAPAWFATLSLDWADSDLAAFATIGPLTPITFDRGLRAKAKSAIPSCATTGPTALRGGAIVELEHAAEAFTAPNRTAAD